MDCFKVYLKLLSSEIKYHTRGGIETVVENHRCSDGGGGTVTLHINAITSRKTKEF